MSARKMAIAAWAAALGIGAAATVAHAADFETSFEPPKQDNVWQFNATPYLWMSGVQGDFSIDGFEVQVDESFTEILDNLRMAFMSRFELRAGRVGFMGDFVYVDADDFLGVDNINVEVDNKVAFATFAASYRPLESGGSYADVFAGIRTWYFDSAIVDHGGVTNVAWSDQWTDPIVGGQGRIQLSDRFFVTGYGDVGGFGMGSDLTWQAMGTVGYELYDHLDVSAGYRYLYVRREKTVLGQDIVSEERFSGPIIEGTLRY